MKHTGNPEHLESSGIFWDVGLRASQLSHTNRGSRPEILEIAPGRNEKEEVNKVASLTDEWNHEPERLTKMKEEYNGDERIWKLR